jgi:fructose-1,6-bisphosphatase II
LKGVRYYGNHITTDTLVVRGLTGTVRQISATHTTDKLENLSAIDIKFTLRNMGFSTTI